MSPLVLRESTQFTHKGVRCEVLNIFRSDNEMRYREIHNENGEYTYVSQLIHLSDFQSRLEAGDIHIEQSKKRGFERLLSAEDNAKILYRERYILRAFKESPSAPTRPVGVDHAIQVVSQSINDQNPPCRATVQRWIKLYRDSGSSKISLLDNYFSTNTRRRQLPEVEEAFQDCIADYYLRKDPYPIEHIYKRFFQRCEVIQSENAGNPDYDFKIPSQGTLRNRIKAFTDEEALIAKYGKTKAKQKIRNKLRKFRVSTILERCEMDGLHIHLGIVDENDTTIFLGSIVLMYVMDVYSRAILGYSLHLTKKKSESADLILACIKHTFSLQRDSRWPTVNKMPLLVTDASAPATSDLCQSYFHENNISLLITTVGQPQEKPFIESLNNTLRRMFLRHLPGYVGREKFRGNTIKLANTVQEQASMTFSSFIREFEHFIHEIYHKNPHSGLQGKAPIDVWNEEFNKQPLSFREQVRMPMATDIHGNIAERKFNKAEDGFTIDKRWYRDAELHKWLVTNGNSPLGNSESEAFDKVTILYSQIDVRTITVIHPKTREPRVVQLADIDNLGKAAESPLQQEEYFAIVQNGLCHLPNPEKKHYEPSFETEKTAREIESHRHKKQSEQRGQRQASRVGKAKHHVIGSDEFGDEIRGMTGKKMPENVVIHENSEPKTSYQNLNADWEDDIDLDDIGNVE